VRTVQNTQIHCVGRMQSFCMLKQVVHIAATVLEKSALGWLQRQDSVNGEETYKFR
jgi:hypothetical protein